MNEKEMEFQEKHIPEMARAAITQAYWAALASGCKVLIAEKGQLIEISPDGTRKVVDEIQPSIPIKIGTKLELP